jgi:hypothetical protein
MTDPIVVVNYDPAWPALFAALRASVVAALQEIAVAIEHVCSTAVPSLATKPILDLDVATRTEAASIPCLSLRRTEVAPGGPAMSGSGGGNPPNPNGGHHKHHDDHHDNGHRDGGHGYEGGLATCASSQRSPSWASLAPSTPSSTRGPSPATSAATSSPICASNHHPPGGRAFSSASAGRELLPAVRHTHPSINHS